MTQPYRYLLIERRADVLCVRLRSHRLLENEIHGLAQELVDLGRTPGCRGLALALGPKSPECLYSVFLAKLYWVRRRLGEQGVELMLCDVDPMVHAIFEACQFDSQFHFARDFDEAAIDLPHIRRLLPQNPPQNGQQA